MVTALPALWGIGSGRAVTARVRGAARNTRPFVSIFLTGGGSGGGKRRGMVVGATGLVVVGDLIGTGLENLAVGMATTRPSYLANQ